jgi:glycosyltransferase involved in cell wall biosynthesis
LARGRGIAESRGAFVALLDDDDTWLPTKIESQFNIANRIMGGGSQHALVACRTEVVLPDGQVIGTAPRRVPTPQESIPEYLFVRRHIAPGEAVISSSMLFFDRELADIVPLDARLPMHDDWDWLLTVQLCTGIGVEFSPEILTRYTQNPAGASVSSSGNWVSSSDWFMGRKKDLSAREFSDGVLCICVPLALQQGKWREAGKLVRTSLREGSPGFPALAFVFLMSAKSLFWPRSSKRRK